MGTQSFPEGMQSMVSGLEKGFILLKFNVYGMFWVPQSIFSGRMKQNLMSILDKSA